MSEHPDHPPKDRPTHRYDKLVYECSCRTWEEFAVNHGIDGPKAKK